MDEREHAHCPIEPARRTCRIVRQTRTAELTCGLPSFILCTWRRVTNDRGTMILTDQELISSKTDLPKDLEALYITANNILSCTDIFVIQSSVFPTPSNQVIGTLPRIFKALTS